MTVLQRWRWILVALVMGSAIGLASCSENPRSPGSITLSEPEFDMGEIGNLEPVSHTVQLGNAGPGWLEIQGVSTSCGCTTAAVGARRLAPGETTGLVITFDPRAHDGAPGRYFRQVYIRSTDPTTPEAIVTFRVTVVAPALDEGKEALP